MSEVTLYRCSAAGLLRQWRSRGPCRTGCTPRGCPSRSCRLRAKREHLKRFQELLPESHGQNLALTVSCAKFARQRRSPNAGVAEPCWVISCM